MRITQTGIQDLLLIEPSVFGDKRGYFFESFNQKEWENKLGNEVAFVQDNESMSQRGVLRGLHFQKPPFAQGKLVRVVRGAVLDVAVDLRKNATTYGQHFKVLLSQENKKQLYVPEGFAHGFLALESDTVFSYKCTQYYNKESEEGLMWNDPQLAIDWDFKNPVLSEKDQQYKSFTDFKSPFV